MPTGCLSYSACSAEVHLQSRTTSGGPGAVQAVLPAKVVQGFSGTFTRNASNVPQKSPTYEMRGVPGLPPPHGMVSARKGAEALALLRNLAPLNKPPAPAAGALSLLPRAVVLWSTSRSQWSPRVHRSHSNLQTRVLRTGRPGAPASGRFRVPMTGRFPAARSDDPAEFAGCQCRKPAERM